MLQIDQLSIGLAQSKKSIVRNVSLTVKAQTITALVGGSGSGKTTLLHMLAGFEKPSSGQVLFDSAPIHETDCATHEAFLQKSIGILFQSPHLIAELSVIENVMIKGYAAGLSKDRALQNQCRCL